MKGKAASFLRKPKASASANASRRAELERLQRMSIEERILAALSVRDRLAGLKPSPLSR
jgi:hypothetical protein